MSWLYELNEHENWTTCEDEYSTKEEAIEAGRVFFKEEYPDESYFDVGEKITPIISTINAYQIIDDMTESMWDEVGEHADSWLDSVTHEQQRDLETKVREVILNWLRETNNIPKFFKVTNVETIQIEV